jgi:hypothetical protein
MSLLLTSTQSQKSAVAICIYCGNDMSNGTSCSKLLSCGCWKEDEDVVNDEDEAGMD